MSWLLRALEVEQAAIGHADYAAGAIDREAAAGIVGEAIDDGVTFRVGGEGRDSHERAVGGILGHAIGGAVAVADGARPFVDIGHIDDEGLGAAEAALVGGGDVDADGRRRLEVEALAGRQLELTADHLEATVGNAERMAVAGIGIADGEIADDRADRVLVDRSVRERDVRRDFVDVVDADDEGLGAAEAALVGGGDVDADGRRHLEIQALAGRQLELTANHLEATVGNAERMAVAGIGIGDGEIADSRADGVLVDGGVRQRDVRRHFVHVVDADDEGLGAAEAALVGGGHIDADRRRRLEVQALPGRQLELTADHLEATVGNAERMAVAGVGIGDGEIADDSADGVLVDRGLDSAMSVGTSFTSLTPMTKVSVRLRPPLSVAVTSTLTVDAASKSRLWPAASLS